MGRSIRIEDPHKVSLLTTKTRLAELWFIANQAFEEEVLAYLAKITEKYGVELYAFCLQGNHYHIEAKFPLMNRSDFTRDLNSEFQRALKRHQPLFEGGTLWSRPYSEEWIPRSEDVLDRFFYCALQAIQNGLTETIEEYPAFNSFHDAINGTEKTYKIFDGTAFYNAKRKDPSVKKSDFYVPYTLKFQRPPEYSSMSPQDYKAFMLKELQRRTIEAKQERIAKGKLGFLGRDKILQLRPGSKPMTTKKSTRNSHRPLVLTRCAETRAECVRIIFDIRALHRDASIRFRAGETSVRFPPGTFRPPSRIPRT